MVEGSSFYPLVARVSEGLENHLIRVEAEDTSGDVGGVE